MVTPSVAKYSQWIYNYLPDEGYAPEREELTVQLANAADPTPIIVSQALRDADACELCSLTLETFVQILAAEAGNLALKILASGGAYLGGGIPPRILQAIDNGKFVQRFSDKGRMSKLLERMPIYAILNSNAALLGAACYGLNQL